MTIREQAPAKVNLLLHVGARRADGLHELCSLLASIDLADELEAEPAAGGRDCVLCPGVEGPNLAEAALAAFRAATGALPPVAITIAKRIPVAAGLGGGSADAAAALRAANAIAGRPLDAAGLRRLAATLGADVPSQIEPAHALVTGAGEGVEPIDLPAMTLVLVPARDGLATARVYAEADRLGATRTRLDADAVRGLPEAGLAGLAARLENDLEAAALSLRPELAAAVDALLAAGALAARLTGSGPTAFGVYGERAAAERAAATIPGALVAALAAPTAAPRAPATGRSRPAPSSRSA